MVNQPTQRFKQGGQALHFVENNQPVLLAAQGLLDVAELAAVFRGFEVKVRVIGLRQRQCQRGLTNLAGAEQHDSW